MGYRLEISKIEHCCDGGKLYGYPTKIDTEKLESYKWLKNHGMTSLDDDDEFGCEWFEVGGMNQHVLTKEEFLEFIKLYIEDKKKYGCYHQYGETLEDYKPALEANEVLIEWW